MVSYRISGLSPYCHNENADYYAFTIPVKSLDTYSFQVLSFFFDYFLRCRIIVKTSKL